MLPFKTLEFRQMLVDDDTIRSVLMWYVHDLPGRKPACSRRSDGFRIELYGVPREVSIPRELHNLNFNQIIQKIIFLNQFTKIKKTANTKNIWKSFEI